MLQKPDPGDWLTWRRTLDGWGYSPLNQINRSNVVAAEDGLDARHRDRRTRKATPLVHDGVMYIPNPGDFIRRSTRRPAISIWEYKRKLSRRRQRPKTNRTHRDLGHDADRSPSADNCIYALDAQTGKLVWETQVLDADEARADASGGPDHRQRQGHHRPPVPARRRPRLVRHHGARRADRQGALAHAHDSRTRRAGRRDVGRRADGAALARRHLDGAELRPRAEPDLRRHVGDDPRAEVHARRQRQEAPLSQLDARARRRHRQDRLVLPAHRRSLGSRSSVRAAARRHRGRARSRARCAWINPKVKPGERRKVITGIPGKTGIVYTLDRADRRVPLGAADGACRTSISNIDGATGKVTVNPKRCSPRSDQTKFVCPGSNGGKNWPAGAYSPLTNAMYMPLQNMCMNADDDGRHARSVEGVRPQHEAGVRARRRQGRHACGRSRPRPARRCGSTSSAPACCRWSRPAAAWSSAATSNGRFKALDDKTGKVLWETNPRLAGQRLSDHASPSAASSTSRSTRARRSRRTRRAA